jgi:hypothetical protein
MGRTHAVALDPDQFAAVFGPKREPGQGRSRHCNNCGDWHSLDKPWPHNCRPPAPPRNRDLAVPLLAPKFEAFRPEMFGETIINDRAEKRAYMDQHELVEYDSGVKPTDHPTDRQWEQEFVQDIKASMEMDPLAIEPVDVIGRTDLNDSPEIDLAVTPVIGAEGLK